MKKVLQIVLAAAAGIMIGIFANQLDTIVGCVCFVVGVVMLTISIAITTNTKYGR